MFQKENTMVTASGLKKQAASIVTGSLFLCVLQACLGAVEQGE